MQNQTQTQVGKKTHVYTTTQGREPLPQAKDDCGCLKVNISPSYPQANPFWFSCII